MHIYRNGNYLVAIDPKDGTKIRITMDNTFRPDFAESADVTLTYKCDGGCPFCYADCTENGKHADLSSAEVNVFIDSLHPFTELALNGNDLSIPGLEEFLTKLKKRQVIANLTVNQKHFIKHKQKLISLLKDDFISGLGVSVTDVFDHSLSDVLSELETMNLNDRIILHVVAGIVSISDLNFMKNKNLKILILGYKTKGRGIEFYNPEVDSKITELENMLPRMFEEKWFKLISFDNLALSQLNVKDKVSEDCWARNYMGDDGTFTFFIDLVKGRYASDSLTSEIYAIKHWNIDTMFQDIQERKKEHGTDR